MFLILVINMRNIYERNLVKKLKEEGNTFLEIGSFLGISKDSAKNLYKYIPKSNLRKRGPRFKINSFSKLSIKRQSSKILLRGEKLNCSKLLNECNIQISCRTLQRHVKREGMVYKKAKMQICLSKKHKLERIKIISHWISCNQNWDKTIFSDEKRFSLDGPDDWRSYVPTTSNLIRQKRQCKGGGIMIWLMVLPNGLLAHRTINGKFKATDYINLLNSMVVPIIKLNFGTDISFQHDNCTVHVAKSVKDFLKKADVDVISWPSKSPDLNIVEDIWSLLSQMVYDGPQFKTIIDLSRKIDECVLTINSTRRDVTFNLYRSFRSRLCTVLSKNGNLCNKNVAV